MREQRSRVIKAWVLLSVFISMMALSALHRHEAVADTAFDCTECAHHVHHSHLTAGFSSIHDCLLCQFLTLNYIAAAAVALALTAPNVSATIRRNANALRNRTGGCRAPRAPPCLENLLERNTIYLLN